ncbi:riboflavin synthase [Pseudohongiella sp.]|uniref:Riboflavin synthase n=1 Tax=marine sediment metagenome TaxID=412755 RepID=A0A0F9W7U1_9ZZZZ|nr:riboflavin synthase [Pseudohongiella sp.]HDZ07581.1 riboflavin synthase [Pseudohongiella sp.]HEA64369.1 riboflavin synthase [Pseudohongiella sp.]
MFTGIIESIGSVDEFKLRGNEWRLKVRCPALDMSDVQLGDSIAVNGCCLTVTAFNSDSFCADVSNESISLTTFQYLKSGAKVNLEKALTPQTRLGGHLVSGHVDGIGELLSQTSDGGSWRLTFRVPDALARYVAQKGSVCIDGTSLTVNTVEGACFSVNIIPHTQQATVIHTYRAGQHVNIEVDLIARYLERLVLGDSAAQATGSAETATGGAAVLTRAFLADHGFGN